MKFVIPQKIKDMIKKNKNDVLMECVLYGHDYRRVNSNESGEMCVCCGNRKLIGENNNKNKEGF